MKMLVIVLTILVLGVNANAQKKPKIKGNNNVTEVFRKIEGSFNVIEIDDGLKVTLVHGRDNNYMLKTDSNLIDLIEFSVFENTLRVYSNFKITSSKRLDIQLTVLEIEHLLLKNGAAVKTKKNIAPKKFYLTGYNSSRFNLGIDSDDVTVILHRNSGGKVDIKSDNTTIVLNDRTDLSAKIFAKRLDVTLNSSAELQVNGEVDKAYINLKGSSKLNARKMKASTADLYTSNTSDVYVNVKKNLEVYAQGRSRIFVYGNPEIELKGFTDKSRIIKK